MLNELVTSHKPLRDAMRYPPYSQKSLRSLYVGHTSRVPTTGRSFSLPQLVQTVNPRSLRSCTSSIQNHCGSMLRVLT